MINIDNYEIVDAIAIVETDNRVVTGDHGHALSAYQIHEAFWLDCLQFIRHRPELHVNLGNAWSELGGDDPFSRTRARDCCAVGVLMIRDYLIAHAVQDTPENIYAAYTIGRAGFKACNFDIKHPDFPAFKRGKCVRVGQLVHQAQLAAHE